MHGLLNKCIQTVLVAPGGTALYVLSDMTQGGQLVVRHAGATKELDFEDSNAHFLCCAAFYAGNQCCYHLLHNKMTHYIHTNCCASQ